MKSNAGLSVHGDNCYNDVGASDAHITTVRRKYILDFLKAPVPKLRGVFKQVPLDVSRFVAQVFPEGFDIAIHRTCQGTWYWFADGMSASQQSLARRWLDRFDPVSTLSMTFEAGALFCARWSPQCPDEIFAWRVYFTIDKAETLVPAGLHFLPSLPSDMCEICGTSNVRKVYKIGAETHVDVWSELKWGNQKPPVTIKGVLFSPIEHDSPLPTFVVDVPSRRGRL